MQHYVKNIFIKIANNSYYYNCGSCVKNCIDITIVTLQNGVLWKGITVLKENLILTGQTLP